MKPLSLLVLLVVVLSSITFTAIAQDLVQHGPDEVYYSWDIVQGRNGRLFLSATGGLYYSDNRGDSWRAVDNPINDIYFDPHLAVDKRNGNLYVSNKGVVHTS